jgi:hypothetical protein
MNACDYWKRLSHLVDAHGAERLLIATYSLYTAVANYREHGKIPPVVKRSPVQRVLCALNKYHGTLIIGHLENHNEDLAYDMDLWPNIDWCFLAGSHTKAVIYVVDHKIRVWIGSANLTGSTNPNLMLELYDQKQQMSVVEHIKALHDRSQPLAEAIGSHKIEKE